MADVVKVTLNNDTLIDISDSTVDSSKVLSSYVGYEGDGDRFVGAYTPPPSVTIVPLSIDQNGTYEAPSSNVAYNPIDVSVPTVTTQSLSVTSNGTYTAPTGTAYTPVTVNVSGGGGSSEGGVKFIDYDGTILHEYTVEEFSELSALPANPTHTGLTSQGWNWTKAQIDAQLEDYPEMPVIVGQMYITDDGKTRLYCHFEEGRLSPYLQIDLSGTLIIDWGDNSPTDTITSVASTIGAEHEYAAPGDYTITLAIENNANNMSGIIGTNNTAIGMFSRLLGTYGTTPSVGYMIYSSALRKVEIGEGIKIKAYAFCQCNNLKSITIPSSITTFYNGSFSYCTNLKSITIPAGIASTPSDFANLCYRLSSISIPYSCTTIGASFSTNAYNLKYLTIPSRATRIGSNAFSNCQELVIKAIPTTVTSIASGAFSRCTVPSSVIFSSQLSTVNGFSVSIGLEEVTIPSGATSIGASAFSSCYSLASIDIPSTVTSIGTGAFSYCCCLQSITIPSGVTTIENSTFNACVSLTSIDIPSTVTSIGSNAFTSCYSLISINIPSTVTSIGTSAFNSCYSLISINIPSTVTSIQNYTFSNCQALTSITIPSDVTSIGTQAFYRCYSMKEYHFLPTTPPTLANVNAFTNIQSYCVIYVPAESLEAYQTATNWSTYASYMQGE